MAQSDITETSRSYSGMEVTTRTGSRRRQTLSNRVEITTDDGRIRATQRLTLRQARALQRFLNETLG
jgi:hypothetical protein